MVLKAFIHPTVHGLCADGRKNIFYKTFTASFLLAIFLLADFAMEKPADPASPSPTGATWSSPADLTAFMQVESLKHLLRAKYLEDKGSNINLKWITKLLGVDRFVRLKQEVKEAVEVSSEALSLLPRVEDRGILPAGSFRASERRTLAIFAAYKISLQ